MTWAKATAVDRRRGDVTTDLRLGQENKKHICRGYRALRVCGGLFRRV